MTTIKKLKVLEHKFMSLITNYNRDLYACRHDITYPNCGLHPTNVTEVYTFKLADSPQTRNITQIVYIPL